MTIMGAKAFLERSGYVVLKAKYHRAEQERRRIARIRMDDAMERVVQIDAWARSVCMEERRVRDRLTFVYGVARAHGASVKELTQETALCDGCDQTLPDVGATPDGRAQLCPSCMFIANQRRSV
jgi:hypothetical protein